MKPRKDFARDADGSSPIFGEETFLRLVASAELKDGRVVDIVSQRSDYVVTADEELIRYDAVRRFSYRQAIERV